MRNTDNGLWDVQFPVQTVNTNQSKEFPQLQANAIIAKNLPKYHLANYLHACAFSPTLSTFQKAISNGHFITWPSIEKINFKNSYMTKLQHILVIQIKKDLIYNQQKYHQRFNAIFSRNQTFPTRNNMQSAQKFFAFRQKNFHTVI